MLGRFRRRVRYWLTNGERARLLREEMEIHLEMKVQELMEDGMPESDARAAAHRQFGNVLQKQEQARGAWIAQWLSDLVQDTTLAMRTLRNQPGFAAVAALSAALGIGACSLIFSVANYALFRPLPVEEPSRLVSISGKNLRRGKVGGSITYPDFVDLGEARSLQGLTAFFGSVPAAVSSNGEPQRYWGSIVTANYFDVVRPAFTIGRGFAAERDNRSGEPPVVVLSQQLWRSRFGGDHTIVGRSIELNGRKVDVVGVTGPGFRGTESMQYSDFWVPFSMAESLALSGMGGERLHDRGAQWLMLAGRLREGFGVKQATAEIEAIGQRLKAAYPVTNKDRAFHLERAGQVNPGLRKMIVVFFLLLLGVAALVLCTACANVANLLLARASARQKEIATRLAIGAGRGRLIRQLLTESVMLALLGGIGGYAIAQLGVSALASARLPVSTPVDLAISLDHRVMLFCVALSVLTGLIFGLVPALRATRLDLTGALKNERSHFGGSRYLGLRNLLVIAQVAICMVLLICTGLFLRSLESAHRIDTGFAHRNLLMMGFDPGLNRYSAGDARRIVESILERAQAVPGVESVTVTSSVPLNVERTQNAFTPMDRNPAEDGAPLLADINLVAPRFFETFGIRMITGADFRPGVPAEDVAIVNQALADKAFNRQNPVGRSIAYQGRVVRIVGLVATTKSRTIGEEPGPSLYFPLARDVRGNDSHTGMTLVVRTSGDPAAYAPLVRRTIRDVDPRLAVFDVRTMEMQLSQALFLPRTAAFLFGFAGLMGLLIAVVGIYGVISFGVARQTKEIGIRMALGAERYQVLGMVLKKGLALTLAGSVIGVCIARAGSGVAASLLYGVSPTDSLTFAVVPAVLVVIALAACLAPARRAATLDPIRALRYE